jgi:hypothetical protein
VVEGRHPDGGDVVADLAELGDGSSPRTYSASASVLSSCSRIVAMPLPARATTPRMATTSSTFVRTARFASQPVIADHPEFAGLDTVLIGCGTVRMR